MRHSSSNNALSLLFIVALLCIPLSTLSQSADLALTRAEQAQLDSLATHAAQKIREANLDEKEPKVLVIDFFRGSSGNSSRLGTLLADRFSVSLASYSSGLKILDREIFKDYLIKEWTTLEDLQSTDVCLRIGRQLGATGVIVGTLYEENGKISLTVHLEGFGRVTKGKDPFEVTDERARLGVTEELHDMLFQRGPNYARTADEIPEEPGVVRAGTTGASIPRCTYCPPPGYSDAARAAKFYGTVLLSVVVTPEGQARSVYVLKGAPFGLTAQAINSVQSWRFEPALKDGKPISVRLTLEATFRLF
jgi:TonB family protein